MNRFAILIALTAFVSTAQAAPETYVIDNSQTVANFSFSYLGMANKTHRFDRTSGRVVFDPVSKTGSAEISIDAASINTGVAMFNNQMQSTGFFDAANHPVITFRSSKMALQGDQMNMVGELTVKGITRQVTLNVSNFQCAPHPELKIDACGANATVTIKRSDFNMGKYAMLASNDVTLSLTIGAVKEQPAIRLASRDIR
ncbi:MAG: YceI family protein [Thiobacillus sp.]